MPYYTSSSDSDDPRPRTVPASTNGSKDEKKKKRKLPPQKDINKMWKRFSDRKFSKALQVLPFSPVAPAATPERGNELFNAGYERAAKECREKVQKIIKECRRINMRYRDPGWDIDWDLKFLKGHCLNGLGKTQFDVFRQSSSTMSVPKAVKRVHEIFEKPTFMENMLGSDVKQGAIGDCWFIAALTGLASAEDGVRRICVEYDTKIGIYGFVFYRDGEWIYSIIDDKLYLTSPNWDSRSVQRELLQQIDREDSEQVYRKMYQTGSKALFFGQCRDQNETWVPLVEKAYAKAHGDYAALIGGWVGEGLEDISGGVTTELLASDIFDTDQFWDQEINKVNQEFLFGCSTGLLDSGYGDRDGIKERHAYNVMEARTLKDGTRLVKLRNPWGAGKKGNWEGPWSDGSKEWTSEVQAEIGHRFADDSVFWISYDDLLRKYQHFDRTRLFRDPSWRSCQRWIGVDVPWKPAYHEKFHIKLTKESPLVLVLSQLDDRYFKGLAGQYHFRLHFRLHEKGKPDAESYIVRSHGNYLMDRSVSVDIPCMEPGEYSLFIQVVGQRNLDIPSVEDVVKRECKKRKENEKFAQVGRAYDLAHSKAAAHMEQVNKVRRKTDGKKASESRKKERHRAWEKRHMNREVQKTQARKNNKKKEAKDAAKEAKAEAERKKAEEEGKRVEEEKKKEEESKPKDKASQTEKPTEGEHKSVQTEAQKDRGDDSDSPQNTPQDTPQDTPTSTKATPSVAGDEKDEKVTPPPTSSGPPPPPPPPPASQETKKKEKLYITSDEGSSASPVSDWEELYSSDDMTKKPRVASAPPANSSSKGQYLDSDEEDAPDPWNAICVVGFRVYSKDEDLELRVVMEGGELEQGGMGERGEADLDDAVGNAGGQHEKEPRRTGEQDEEYEADSEVERKKKKDGMSKKEDGYAGYPIIVRKTEDDGITDESKVSAKEADEADREQRQDHGESPKHKDDSPKDAPESDRAEEE